MRWMLLLPLTLAVLITGSRPVAGSSVEGVGILTMIQGSELIFEGVVEGSSVLLDATGTPRTWVRFRVLETLKGDPIDRLSLGFAGGVIGKVGYEVSESPIPSRGEHGIFFVESLHRTLVNPLYGWRQGILRIESRDRPPGPPRRWVTSHRGRPIVAVGGPTRRAGRALSSGVAQGLVEGEAGDVASALTPEALGEWIRASLGDVPR